MRVGELAAGHAEVRVARLASGFVNVDAGSTCPRAAPTAVDRGNLDCPFRVLLSGLRRHATAALPCRLRRFGSQLGRRPSPMSCDGEWPVRDMCAAIAGRQAG